MSTLFIGMPVCNGERFIAGSLDTLKSQSFADWTLLISDNHSTDSTQAICQEYCNNDGRIKYHRQTENIGAINNFRFLLEHANAPYFMWAAADDIWDKSFVEACINGLNLNPQAGLAFTNIVNVDSFGRVIREYPSFNRFVNSSQHLSIARFILDPEQLGKANLIYGVYKLASLKQFMIQFLESPEACHATADMAFNLGILCRTRLYIDERVLFMKRYVKSTDSPARLDRSTTVARYFNGVKRQEEFASYKQAIAAACRGTQFEDLVNFLIGYRERLNIDIGQVIEENKRGLLTSRKYRIGEVVLAPLSLLKKCIVLLRSRLGR